MTKYSNHLPFIRILTTSSIQTPSKRKRLGYGKYEEQIINTLIKLALQDGTRLILNCW